MQPGFDGVEKVPFKGEEPGPCMERGMDSLAQCPFALSLKSPSAPNSPPQPQEPPQAPTLTLTPSPPLQYSLHPHRPTAPSHCIHAMFVLRKWQSMHREGSGLMFLLQAQAFKSANLRVWTWSTIPLEQSVEDVIYRKMFGGNLAQMSFS